MSALQVKDAYGINEVLLVTLAKTDTTWETAAKIWAKAKYLRFDSLTPEQMHALESIEMDLQEHEANQVYRLLY